MRPWEGGFEVIVREGSGGPRRYGPLLVCKARILHATTLHGLPITTPERTLADLWPRVDATQQGHMLRNALRLKRLTIPSLDAHLQQASARHRPRTLTDQLARYHHLQLHRCRSDAEALAVVILADANVPAPRVNVRIAGDARKTAVWRAAGWDVERIPAQDVYDEPQRLTRAAPPGS